MTEPKQPIIIKKYANRRLYNTGSSVYVTLEDLAQMVKAGEDFLVNDAKTGEDITRSVLAQIIFEQEGKQGQSLLPITFLRQLIRFYGDSMQMLVPSYLQFTLDNFVADQQKIREQMSAAFGVGAGPGEKLFSAMEEQARKNIALFTQSLGMFNPFIAGAGAAKPAPEASGTGEPDLERLRRQVAELQRNVDAIAKKN